ncbi:MAG TPA: VanZ family protein [Clostridia bacterium]|nr:VanZ family protein [Clostridia bacterium]
MLFSMKRILRPSLWATAALYAAAFVYVLFFWSTAIGYDRSWRSFNLRPLAGLAHAYLGGDGLARSQFMLNILLFAPLGFLLPLLFPRAAGKLWKTALLALAATILAETAQYFIGRSADVDDVIANFLGGVAGWALFALARAILGKTAFWRALSNNAERTKPLAAVAALLGAGLIFGFPFALDALDAHRPYGLFRYVSASVPASASIRCDLGGAGAQEEPVYLARTGLAQETAERVLALFPAPEGAERSETSTDGYGGGNMIRVTARDGSYRLTALGDGGFHISVSGEFPEEEESFGAWVESVLPRLAPAGVTLSLTDVRVEGGVAEAAGSAPGVAAERVVTALADAKTADETVLVLGRMSFAYRGGELWISSSVALADPAGSVQTISAAEALKAARGPGTNDSFAYTDIEITSVEPAFFEARGKYLPCYLFSGTAKYEGEAILFECLVDAVER